MRKLIIGVATGAAFVLSASAGQAMPVTGSPIRDAADTIVPIEKTAVYVFEGRRYCFYFDGWHGPGWYRCGFSWRRGLGWGGVYGWQGWNYGPAFRRFGHGGGFREGFRSGATIREGSSVQGGRLGASRSGASQQGFSQRRGGAPSGTVGSGGNAGVSGQGQVQGGASVSAPAAGGGVSGSGGATMGGSAGGNTRAR